MPITQNLDEILQQENKMQKMEQLLSQPPIKIKKKKEKCKRKKMNAIEKSIVWLMGIVGLCVINKMVPSLSMIYISFVSGLTILGGIKLVFDIKSIIKTKRAIDGLECQMYFLQNEIPLEQERLRNLYRKAKKIEGPKEEKIKKVNKIKTFTYNKKTKKFLTMEDIIKDLDALDYNIKKQLLEKYRNRDIDFLTNVNYDYFTIDDDNLTLYLGPQISKEKGQELIYLDIPLNSLKLLIDIDKSSDTDNYLSIKKKNIDYDDKVVALTFDDGPSKYTDKILDTLKKYDACATFFVIGNKVEFYNETLKRMINEGNEIGNHSYNHKWLNRLSKQEFQDELNKTQEKVKQVTGFTPKLFRPTYGGYSDRLKSYTDLTFVLWDVDSSDWKVKKKEKILNNIIPNVKDGSIILMHDNHEYSVNAIDSVVKTLHDKGYKFVTVSELLELKKIRENEWQITT